MTIRHPPTLFFFIFSPSNSFAITLYTHTHTAGRVLLGIPPNNKGQISTIYFSSVFPREMTTGVVEQLSLSLSSSNLFFFFYTYTSNTRWGLIGWTCKYRPEKKKKRNLLYIYISILLLLLLFSREMCLYIYTLFCTSFSLSIFQILFFNNSACVCLCAALLTSSIIKRRQKLYLFIYFFFFFCEKLLRGSSGTLKIESKWIETTGSNCSR